MKQRRRSLPDEAANEWRWERDHADGVLCSANVPRPSASSSISLRRAHHRRDPDAQWLIRPHNAAYPVPRVLGIPRSEIKEEPKAGDIRGGGYPAPSARAPSATHAASNAMEH